MGQNRRDICIYILYTCCHVIGLLLHALYKYVYMIILFGGDSARSFYPVSASVCDSRNWNYRSNSFVRAPSSGGGSHAPRPAVSVPHLAGIGYVGWARQARSAQNFVFWAVYARVILGSWHVQSLNKKTYKEWENIYFQVGMISKLASYFIPTTLFSWSHLEAFALLCASYDWLLCRCFSIPDFKVKYLCSSVRCLRGGPFPTQQHYNPECPWWFFTLERYNYYNFEVTDSETE